MKRHRTKVSRKTSSARIFAAIDDLLIQVFLLIPLKQVYRLKLVSKHWNSIISDPKLHLSLRNPEPAVGLIFNLRNIAHHDKQNRKESYFLYFDQPTIPKPIGRGFEVLHSCNGLLLCRSVYGGYERHYIYNPITKKTSTFDPGTGVYPCKSMASICGMYLAFDPSKSCRYKFVCVVGLGQLCWFNVHLHNRVKFVVYSSETGTWRRCGEPFSATVDFKGGVYWKGAIHWVSSTKAGKSIYFNPSDENDQMLPTVMPSPPVLEDEVKRPPWYEGRNYHFGESCGHLSFIDARRRAFEFNVYEMKTDYSEWFVKYTVDLSNVVYSDLFSICTLVRGNKDDDSFLVLRVRNKLMRCNLVDKTCETILECERKTKLEKELLCYDAECERKTKLEKELLDHDAEFPLQYIERANGNLDGVWYTEQEI